MTDTPHTSSWYAATALPRPDYPRLEGDVRCDVCVIGGGYTGLSTALHLAERGYDVVVVEAGRVGSGASGRNGGQIVTGYNTSMATLAGWVGPEDARKLWDLGEEAKALLAERVERHAIDCDLRWGYLFAAIKDRHLRELEAARTEWQDGYGYDRLRMVGRDEVHGMVDTSRYVGGLFDSGGGQIHPLNYAIGLARAAERAGARIFEETRAIEMDTGPSPMVRTERASVRARYLVLAANGYLGGLAPKIAAKIMPVATYMIATEPLGDNRATALIPSGVAVADSNFVLNYYRRSLDHRLLFGGGVSYSGLNRPGLRQALRGTMLKFFPQLADVNIDYCWGGNVAITMDRTPHFGRLGPATFFAHGFSGHGVALTGLAGKLIAEAVAGTAERFDVFARIPHQSFPGGPLRVPMLVLAMLWYRMRDLL